VVAATNNNPNKNRRRISIHLARPTFENSSGRHNTPAVSKTVT
jgi:hypothetical protein